MSGNTWQSYVDNLMADGTCEDAAIVGYCENKYVWASGPVGHLRELTAEQIDALASKERGKLCTEGVCLGKTKCSLIRDELDIDQQHTMDLRTKDPAGGPTCNISIAKAGQVLVLVMGKEGIHGGSLNKKSYAMAKYLRESGF
ncbi:profilin-2 isoform X1 [Thalassophryne amazonica]|uniref:profilin-2 isoform X1 n=1 Tax=Thalassophryne amazonica TaxID=390379 RepID=UPI001471423D|nr:profilin-2 isoform X1 [Thalassophryne amazonica]